MKVQTLRGFRDYLPEEMLAKDRMLSIVRRVFELHGYPPLMTPALEYASVLMGKIGDEGEMLLYRFLDHGDREVALRYDLTVPLARVLTQYGDLQFPFRRYQIAPVWRAEKPAKGRYREFMQCDVDLVGVNSAAADSEMLLIGCSLLDALGVGGYSLKVGHREILSAMVTWLGLVGEKAEGDFLRTLDKLDKIGIDRFKEEIDRLCGLSGDQVDSLLALTSSVGTPSEVFDRLISELGDSVREPVSRLEEVFAHVESAGYAEQVKLDLTIARGLSYYTGIIYETFLDKLSDYGSVLSGGRYDRLIGSLAGKDLPAIGISLGVDRLFSALKEMNILEDRNSPAQVLVVQFSSESVGSSVKFAHRLREAGIAALLYPSAAKLKKQFQFANNLEIPFTAVIGEEEERAGTVQLKEMASGEQAQLSVEDAIKRILSAGGEA